MSRKKSVIDECYKLSTLPCSSFWCISKCSSNSYLYSCYNSLQVLISFYSLFINIIFSSPRLVGGVRTRWFCWTRNTSSVPTSLLLGRCRLWWSTMDYTWPHTKTSRKPGRSRWEGRSWALCGAVFDVPNFNFVLKKIISETFFTCTQFSMFELMDAKVVKLL